MQNLKIVPWLVVAVVGIVAVWVIVALRVTPEEAASEQDLQRPFGYAVTEGAAAGYLPDSACATCHIDLFTSYQDVGMSRSFAKPRPEVYIEDFEAEPYFHPASERYYEMRLRGDRMFFKRYQHDDDGQPINVFEREVDWILGSGNKTRSYLYQTETGELFQLPIDWYTETEEWRMSPGYDSKYHQGLQRQVRRECMFCHNAFPNVPAGSDARWEPHLFPKQLPEGTGCQRCHGPGAEHVRTALGSERSLEGIRASIVNPARLHPERRDAVCFQCHMLPAISVIGTRRFDRADYSFRPGEALTDYLLHVDVREKEKSREERFEINHHAYRLQQSACFQKSAGALTCITCHNPHRKVPQEERVAHYGAVCLSCHEPHAEPPAPAAIAPDDCTACHMPQRRTQDVIHVVMTDHNIQRRADNEPERLAPLQEIDHVIEGVEFLTPEHAPEGTLGQIYLTVAQLRARPTPDLVDYLEDMIEIAQPTETMPYFDLANGLVRHRRYDEAEHLLQTLLAQHPNHPILLQWMGITHMGLDELVEAENWFRQALAQRSDMVEVHFNLGLSLTRQRRFEEAAEQFRQTIAVRPSMAVAWFYLGFVSAQLGRLDEAVEHYRHALEIEPTHTQSYLGLARALIQKGERAEARRFLKHGVKTATQPDRIAEVLAQMSE